MSELIRYKGKFMKKNVVEKRLKALAAMSAAKKKSSIKNLATGRRIVEIRELAKNLTCCFCKENIHLKHITSERRLGLNSIFKIRCQECMVITEVTTGKFYKFKNCTKRSDVNTKAALGTVHAGMGWTSSNKLLVCLNIPTISPTLFKKYEREIGPAIEETAKESCERGAEEERRLVFENIENLCQEQPYEIAEELYGQLKTAKSAPQEEVPSSLMDEDIEPFIPEETLSLQSSNSIIDSNTHIYDSNNNINFATEEMDATKENIINVNIQDEVPSSLMDEDIEPFISEKTLSLQSSSSIIYSNTHIYDSNDNRNFPLKELNATSDNKVNIIVSYDMDWSKRGNGKSYDRLNGYGALIDFSSGKISDFSTRNRKCRLCELGYDKKDHDCRLNFQGSAKGMEADEGAELVNQSSILAKIGLVSRVLIADKDSSTPAATRRGNKNEIFKLADENHLKKHFTSDLYELRNHFKEMKRADVIPHLKKCFNYAVAQHKRKSLDLANTLRMIPDHVFGRHENCGLWCNRDDETKKQTILLKDLKLHTALTDIFKKYADNSAKFPIAVSSQANENLNNMMAHKALKNVCYSLSESSDYRWASAVCTKNDGDQYVTNVSEKLNLSPGKHTMNFTEKQDKIRIQRAEKVKSKSFRSRRNFLKQNRANLRKKNESEEGTQYEPNCGLQIDVGSLSINTANDENKLRDYKIVYFDLETGGLGNFADILQIAAKTESHSFCVYVEPTQPISKQASDVTGLTITNGKLCHNNGEVNTFSLELALRKFKKFLNTSSKPSILVAHNVQFDRRYLINAIVHHSMVEEYRNIIVGFSDSTVLLRKRFPDRKGKEKFKLITLAQDLLPAKSETNFHKALFDVEVLEELVCSFISPLDLINNSTSYDKAVQANKIKELTDGLCD